MVNLDEFNVLTHRVIGCAMTVHTRLGSGYLERVYQNALAIELKKHGIAFAMECEKAIYYDGIEVGMRRADFIVENRLLLELKAVAELTDVHFAQTINYLEAFRFDVGLLLNFGSKRLTYKRFIKSQYPAPG
jgi:GxxExxY protein